jgi:hypothetical protein
VVKPLRNPNRFGARLKRQSDRAAIDIRYVIFWMPGSDARMILGKGADGTPFLPAFMHPSGADGAFLKAGLDKIAVGEHEGNLYVPAAWLRAQMASDPQAPAKIAVVDRMVDALKSVPA